jgi:cobalt-zinc-cadmium efflux system outer membrane protein
LREEDRRSIDRARTIERSDPSRRHAPFILFTAAVVTILSAGCAKYTPRPITPAETASAFEARTLESPRLREFIESSLHREVSPWPPASWDFSTLLLAACYYHPDLAMARAKWRVAEAGKITAGERPNPGISVPPGFVANPSKSPWLYGAVLDIPIETAGKRGYRMARAGHLADAAHLNIQTAAWHVRSRLRSALLDLYTSRKSLAELDRELAVREELVGLMSLQLAHGEISRPDATQARISLDRTRLTLQEAKMKEAERRVRLASALGLPVRALQNAEISYDFLEQLPPALPQPELRRLALLSRPDILGALAEYEAAQSALQLQIAKQYPDLHLGPGYHFDDSENKWTFGISLTLPVLNQNQGPIAEASARREEAAARFIALQAGVIEEMDRATAGYQEALRKLETAKNLEASARDREEAAKRRLEAGETDRLTLLDSKLILQKAAIDRLMTFYQAQQALGLLEDALRSPVE